MSSTEFTADVMLNGAEYQKLDRGPQTVNDWFSGWKRATRHNDTLGLLTLAHWGLQLPFHREKDQDSVVQLFCHYLAVADGHQSVKNFGHNDTKWPTIFGEVSDREIKHKLADKAWTELCNRVFVFSEDGFGEHMKYSWHFRQPSLATAFMRFIDPKRWSNVKRFHYDQANLHDLNESAYQAKALKFTRQFLREAWGYREIVRRESRYQDIEECDYALPDLDEEERVEMLNRLRFFRRLKPELAKLMIYYNLIGFLDNQKLDSPTRRVFREFAFSNSFLYTPVPGNEAMDLALAYGELDPKHGYPVCSNRDVAKLLLLYPLVVAGRRRYVKEVVRKKQEAKAAKAGELQAQLENVAAQLKAL